MNPRRIRARHFQTGEVIDLTLDAGRVTAIGGATDAPVDLAADFVAPAFFDLQINGGWGVCFTHPGLTTNDVRSVAERIRRC